MACTFCIVSGGGGSMKKCHLCVLDDLFNHSHHTTALGVLLVFLKARWWGWPSWLLNFIEVLYRGNFCDIVLDDARYSGFDVSRGIRQGCPLSPYPFILLMTVIFRDVQLEVDICIYFNCRCAMMRFLHCMAD